MQVLTALPAANQPRAEEVTALVRREPGRLDRVVLQERVELGHKLEQVPQRDEATVEGPWGTGDGVPGCGIDVVLATAKDHSLADSLLAGIRVSVEVLDRGLRDTVEEAEATWKDQLPIRPGLVP